MKQILILTKPLVLFILGYILIPSLLFAQDVAVSCTNDKTLSRNARVAMVNAQKHESESQVPKAMEILTKFMADFPDEIHVFIPYTLAGYELDSNHLSRAAKLYQKTLDICPEFAAAWQNLGKVSFDLKEYATAAKAFETVWILGNKTEYIYRYHAAIAHAQNKTKKKALEHLFFLTDGKVGTPDKNWVKLMAHLCMEEKQSPKALTIIEKLLKKDNPEPYLFKLATSLFLETNQYTKAAKALAAYSMMKPLTSSEQKLMADLYYNIGIPYKAAYLYEKTLNGNIEKDICEKAATAWYEAFEFDTALALIDDSLKTYPDSHVLWRLKAWISYEKSNFHQAGLLFSKASQLKRTDHQSLFMMGFSEFKAGEYKKASNTLKKAASKQQYKKQAKQLLAQIKSISEKSVSFLY